MSDLLANLIASGTPAKLVADVAMLLARAESAEAQLSRRRAGDAERKARSRENQSRTNVTAGPATSRDGAGQKTSPHTPLRKTNPLSPANAGSPRRRTEQASRLPDDFTVPDDWLDWGIAQRGWTRAEVAEEAACFCRYWQARGRDAARRCWRRTWQNWVCNSRRPGTGPARNTAKPAFARAEDWNRFCDEQAAVQRAIGRERTAIEWERHKRSEEEER